MIGPSSCRFSSLTQDELRKLCTSEPAPGPGPCVPACVAGRWTFTTCGFETDLPCMLAYDYACARASPRSFTCPVEIMAIAAVPGTN